MERLAMIVHLIKQHEKALEILHQIGSINYNILSSEKLLELENKKDSIDRNKMLIRWHTELITEENKRKDTLSVKYIDICNKLNF